MRIRIKKLREALGLSQKELANRLGVSMHSVWRWENGYVEPRASELQVLANEFSCSVDYLVNPPSPPGKKERRKPGASQVEKPAEEFHS